MLLLLLCFSRSGKIEYKCVLMKEMGSNLNNNICVVRVDSCVIVGLFGVLLSSCTPGDVNTRH